ncbi:YgjV family protein, partial [Acidithiobacillus sp.]|uniref:YgjV family protein n=1 Tax=Acidithiobacillus sp. TaxID=1872118 RepID=UPI003CFE0FD3
GGSVIVDALSVAADLSRIPWAWWSGLAACLAAGFAFTRTGKRSLLWSTLVSGGLVSLTFRLWGDDFASSVIVASLCASFLQGWLDERYRSTHHTALRVAISAGAIAIAVWVSPPHSGISLLVFAAYANAKIAHAYPNLFMKLWILPSTALWIAYAAYLHVYPIVLLEIVTLVANLLTITRLVRHLSHGVGVSDPWGDLPCPSAPSSSISTEL